MQQAQDHYPDCPEVMMVKLAQSGDRAAFAELVRRRHGSVRHLMRRCCLDSTLADDLAQQAFLQAWLKIRSLKKADAFGGWLKRVSISIWLQYQRKNVATREAEAFTEFEDPVRESPGMGLDLERALSTLPVSMRLCVVLSHQEGMSHAEIAKATELPLGTVKSNVLRGSNRLRQLLSVYRPAEKSMEESEES